MTVRAVKTLGAEPHDNVIHPCSGFIDAANSAVVLREGRYFSVLNNDSEYRLSSLTADGSKRGSLLIAPG